MSYDTLPHNPGLTLAGYGVDFDEKRERWEADVWAYKAWAEAHGYAIDLPYEATLAEANAGWEDVR